MTVYDIPPAIGSQFPPEKSQLSNREFHSQVIAVGQHGTNPIDPNIDQFVILVAQHRTVNHKNQDQTYSVTYNVYIAERKLDADGAVTNNWTVLYEKAFNDIMTAVNGMQEQHGRWATDAEKKQPKPWLAGFVDCLLP